MAQGDPQALSSAVETWRSVEAISHPLIREVACLWQAKRRGRLAPSRRDLDPDELRLYLPNIFMLDVVEPGMRFRVRLMGTGLVRATGRDNTGRFLDEVLPASHYPGVREELDDVVTRFVPRYAISSMAWQRRSFARYHRLMVPLSDDEVRVNIVFGVLYMIVDEHGGIPIAPLKAAIEVAPLLRARVLEASRPG
ncbi:MAG: PAS domain-containing protein [Proteobacteria bacterium]|nr:PAS domain-containing protein [Pseudomonadota bacterium]MBI3499592.1 PAS domain-containing protein [Pseudomonadota bacterium]